jgi:hypothetical protein
MFKKIGSFLLGIGSWLAGYIKTAAARMLDEIGPIAEDVVRQVEKQSNGQMSGSEKFNLAKEILMRELTARGISFTVSIIHSALEMAVDLLQERNQEVKG